MQQAKSGNIEPGCLAMIVNRLPEDNGKIVTVIESLGRVLNPNVKLYSYYEGDRWRIDKPVQIYGVETREPKGYTADHVQDKCLVRISPEEGQFDQEVYEDANVLVQS